MHLSVIAKKSGYYCLGIDYYAESGILCRELYNRGRFSVIVSAEVAPGVILYPYERCRKNSTNPYVIQQLHFTEIHLVENT